MTCSELIGKDKLIKIMSLSTLFKSLDEAQVEKLLDSGKISSYSRGTILHHQGDLIKQIYLILDGSVMTLRTSEGGDEALLQLLHPGDTFMEAFVFLNAPLLVSVQAITEATLLTIPASAVHNLVYTNSYFSQNIIKVISEQYKEAILKIDSILLRSPFHRVGYYLLKLLIAGECNHLRLTLPSQKSLIANHLGMKPETLSRALAEIKKIGIHIECNEITLPTVFSLCQFCDMETSPNCKNNTSPNCLLIT